MTDVELVWWIILYAVIFLYGIVIGSFLNVCILRVPLKESIAKERSHCMNCGYQLKWYDLIPLFSYLFLGGKCRKCKAHISLQYPIVEGLNGVLYVLIFLINGWSIDSVIYCLLTSALIVLSVIDFRTYEIPVGINWVILTLGLVRLIYHMVSDYMANGAIRIGDYMEYGIGLVAVSGFLLIVNLICNLLIKKDGMGGGDIKLMGAAGLLLGWKLIILAFMLGCIIGSVIHIIRMKISKEDHVLAFGPYLAAGIFIAALWGEKILSWYLGMYNFKSF